MNQRPYLNFFSCLLIFIFCASLLVNPAQASDISSASFIVRDPVVGAGGGYGTSATFKMFQSLDPVLIGVNASASFLGHYGFLYFSGAVVTPTPTPTPTPSGGGGGTREISNVCNRIADFNCDGRVDLLDFSILLFYTDKVGSIIVPFDLSKDGRIDLMDVSIMFYYWDTD